MNKKIYLIPFLFLVTFWIRSVAIAQDKEPVEPEGVQSLISTDFSYQGRLEGASGPYNGTCDFRFGLFASYLGTDQIGSTLTRTNGTVSDGYFTIAQLYFGTGAFNGEERFLQIEVRCPAGTGEYTPLTPRQSIKPVPYASALPGLWTQPNLTSPNIIGGYFGNIIGGGIIGGTISGGGVEGEPNEISGNYGTISGGRNNLVAGEGGATVGGGYSNRSEGRANTIGGGEGNSAEGWYHTTIGGGVNNIASWSYSTISGGNSNTASAIGSTISGGITNTIGINSDYGVIGGGAHNAVSGGWVSSIGGGWGNLIDGEANVIAGGAQNSSLAEENSFIGGGASNATSGSFSVIQSRLLAHKVSLAVAMETPSMVWLQLSQADKIILLLATTVLPQVDLLMQITPDHLFGPILVQTKALNLSGMINFGCEPVAAPSSRMAMEIGLNSYGGISLTPLQGLL